MIMKQLLYILLLLPVIGNAQLGKKISELPKVDALTSADLVPVVQNGKNYSATVSKFANASVPDTVTGTHLFTGVVQLDSIQLTGNGVVLRPVSVSKDSLTGALGRGCASDCYWLLNGNGGTTAGTNFIGTTDAVDLVFKVDNTEAGRLDATTFNISFGVASLTSITSGGFNVGIGAGANGATSGNNNIALGQSALGSTLTGDNNVGIGNNSGFSVSTGFQNTAIGGMTGTVTTTGSRNTCIGYGADVLTTTTASSIAIGAGALVGCDSCASYGDTTANIKHGFGTAYPTCRLDVRGAIKIVDGSQAAGKILTSDASGNATWSNQILTGSATLDFGTIAPNGHETLTITVTGAALGDVVSLGIPNSSTNDHGAFMAWVSATNTVSVKCFNFDGVGFDPASGTFTAKIFK